MAQALPPAAQTLLSAQASVARLFSPPTLAPALSNSALRGLARESPNIGAADVAYYDKAAAQVLASGTLVIYREKAAQSRENNIEVR